MVDSKYITDDYKSPKISVGAIMKNPKMFKFVPDQFKTIYVNSPALNRSHLHFRQLTRKNNFV